MPDSLVRAFELIAERRRSAYAYLQRTVPRTVIDRSIRIAMLAPNHHRTRPWRFHVYEGAGRAPLADAYEAAALRLGRDPALARRRALDAPAMIVVACIPATSNPKVRVGEEEFATAAAIENLLLALTSSGVAALITTGRFAESPEVHELIGLDARTGRVMAVVNVGYRDPERPIPVRVEPDVAAHTTWHDSP
jgi:nitroreductase